jgi:PAS domain S-box-containing protein
MEQLARDDAVTFDLRSSDGARPSRLRSQADWLSSMPEPPDDVRRYALPAVLVALGTLVAVGIERWTGVTLPAPVIIAVLLSTWYGGARSGIIAFALGLVCTWVFIAEPRGSFGFETGSGAVVTITFAAMAGIFGVFYQSAREAQRHSQRATRETLDLVEQQRDLAAAITASEERYSSLAEAMPAHVVMTGIDGSFIYCNQSYYDYTGLSFEQASNWQEHVVIHPDDFTASMERWEQSLTTGAPLRSEMRLRRHDGAYRWFLVNGSPVRVDGEISRWITVSVDIDDRKAAEAAREASEQRANVALSAAGMGSYEIDLARGTAIWDAAQADLFGLDVAAQDAATFMARVHPDDRAAVQSQLETLARDGGVSESEFRVVHPQRQVRWLSGWGRAIDGPDGQRRLIGVNQDVTERKRDEARRDALAEASQQFVRATQDLPSILDLVARRVVDAIGDQCGIRLLSDDGQRLETTCVRHRDPEARAFLEQTLGASRERDYDGVSQKVLESGATFFEAHLEPAALRTQVREDYWPYLDRYGVSSMIIVPLRAGAENIGTMTLTRDTGSDPYTVDDATFAEEIADRAALAIQNARLFEDLSAHVLHVQEALDEKEASEDRFRLAAATSRLGTWEWDLAERIVWSESLERIHGYEPGEFPQTFAALLSRVHPDDREMTAQRINAAVESDEELDFEHRMLLPSGELRWLNGRGRLVRDANGKPFRMVGICMDITERKQAAEMLKASESRYRALNGALPSIISTTDADGRVDYFNDRWYEFTGLGSEQSLPDGWQRVTHPEDWEQASAHWRASLTSGDPLQIEIRLRRHDGEYRWHLVRMLAIGDTEAVRHTWVIAAIDIDDRVRAEEAREELLHDLAAANAAKDEFLGLVSHELKTPITTILGNAYVLENRGDLVDEASKQQALHDIHSDADRLHRIIDNLLVLARLEQGQEIEVEPIILGRLVEHVVEDQRRHSPARRVNIINVGSRRPVIANPFYVEHVFRNLLSNAEKYSPDTAAIDVRIVRSEHEVSVSVLDRGAGVPQAEQDAIFTPFYRSPLTAKRAAGIGIGLAVCKRLIEAQHGRIWMRTRQDGGSEFGFALPVLDAALDLDDDRGHPSDERVMSREQAEAGNVARGRP